MSAGRDGFDYGAIARELFPQHLDLTPLRGRDHGLVRCIFHADRTASLSVNIAIGTFNCFGCGAQGGVVDFARRIGADLPVGDGAGRPPRRLRPLAEARLDVLRLGRQQIERMARYRELYAAADEEREGMRVVDRARQLATQLDPDDPRTWDLLADAADLERSINRDFSEAWT